MRHTSHCPHDEGASQEDGEEEGRVRLTETTETKSPDLRVDSGVRATTLDPIHLPPYCQTCKECNEHIQHSSQSNLSVELNDEFMVSNLQLDVGKDLILPGKEHTIPGAFPEFADTSIKGVTRLVTKPFIERDAEQLKEVKGAGEYAEIPFFTADGLKRTGIQFVKNQVTSRVQNRVEAEIHQRLPPNVSNAVKKLKGENIESSGSFLVAVDVLNDIFGEQIRGGVENVATELADAGRRYMAFCTETECEIVDVAEPSMPAEISSQPTEQIRTPHEPAAKLASSDRGSTSELPSVAVADPVIVATEVPVVIADEPSSVSSSLPIVTKNEPPSVPLVSKPTKMSSHITKESSGMILSRPLSSSANDNTEDQAKEVGLTAESSNSMTKPLLASFLLIVGAAALVC
jgi:hypothetical protein